MTDSTIPAPTALPSTSAETSPAAGGFVDVTDEMIERALHAPVPGGSVVWVWLPQEDAWKPNQNSRDVIACALLAALNPSDPDAYRSWRRRRWKEASAKATGTGSAGPSGDAGHCTAITPGNSGRPS